MKLSVFIGILLFFATTAMNGQNVIDSASFQCFFPYHSSAFNHPVHSKGIMNRQMERLYRFYKLLFSAQDVQSCAFSPSCSSYSIEAIRKKGFFIGFCETFDRLSRCNLYSAKFYLRNKNGELLIDSLDTDH